MAARPRKNNVSVPNLYPLYSRKVNKVYWRYKHPITGKFHALGTDEAQAVAIATEANERLAEQRTRQILAISDRIATSKGKAITVSTWLDRYWKIQEERLATGDIRLNTFKQKSKPVSLLRERVGMKLLPSVDVHSQQKTPAKKSPASALAWRNGSGFSILQTAPINIWGMQCCWH